MSLLRRPEELSVTDATRRGVAGIISDATEHDIIVTRRRQPVAAIVSIERIEAIDRKLEDIRDLSLAVARVLTDTGERVSFNQVLNAYGLTLADLDAMPDDD